MNKLPQLYQPIFRHSEFTKNIKPQRSCVDRIKPIIAVMQHYITVTGKPVISLLDIGCAQGYLCFSLKEYFKNDVEIVGVDIDQTNIDVCSILNKENSFDIDFRCERLCMGFVDKIQDGQFDVVLLLSVIHHETRPNGSIYDKAAKGGFKHAKALLEQLVKKSGIVIAEFALREEFKADFGELPGDYMHWIPDGCFYRKIGDFSRLPVADEDIGENKGGMNRPMLIISDKHVF